MSSQCLGYNLSKLVALGSALAVPGGSCYLFDGSHANGGPCLLVNCVCCHLSTTPHLSSSGFPLASLGGRGLQAWTGPAASVPVAQPLPRPWLGALPSEGPL